MEKTDKAFNLLLKKLSALRATLTNDERGILDGMVIGPSDDVFAHSMGNIPISPARSTARSTARATAADEARANSMNVDSASAGARSTARSTARATAADEARANSMQIESTRSTSRSTSRATAADDARANSMDARVVFDQTKGEYQRIK